MECVPPPLIEISFHFCPEGALRMGACIIALQNDSSVPFAWTSRTDELLNFRQDALFPGPLGNGVGGWCNLHLQLCKGGGWGCVGGDSAGFTFSKKILV